MERTPSNDQWKFKIVWWWKDCLVKVDWILVQPRSRSWKSAWLLNYLDMYPICNPLNVAFLNQTMTTRLRLAEQAQQQAHNENELLQRNWTGKYPYLMLLCALWIDNIKAAFLGRHDIGNRIELDGHNSVETRPKTVWELIADLWNDIHWEPTTEVFPELHSDYIIGETIHHDLVLDMRHAMAEHIRTNMN